MHFIKTSGKMHFLLISENEFFYEIKGDGKTRYMDFTIKCHKLSKRSVNWSIQTLTIALLNLKQVHSLSLDNLLCQSVNP